MIGQFRKMHGLGNDFVVIDARVDAVEMTPQRARAIADRREGIGCDQLIIIEPSIVADVAMRIFNADGSEVGACGNATRAVALLLGGSNRIETQAGILVADAADGEANVDMGEPRFDWESIPLAYAMDSSDIPAGWGALEHGTGINIGNPHIVFFVASADAIPLDSLGPLIEHDPLFPERVNVNVAEVTGPSALRLRVWERGAGLTRACGTGACASAVAAIRRKLVTAPVAVELPGGRLVIDWQPGGRITMAGPAVEVFRGETDWSRFG